MWVSEMPKVCHRVVLFHTFEELRLLSSRPSPVCLSNMANKLSRQSVQEQLSLKYAFEHTEMRVYIKLCLKSFQASNTEMSSQMREFPETSNCTYIG